MPDVYSPGMTHTLFLTYICVVLLRAAIPDSMHSEGRRMVPAS